MHQFKVAVFDLDGTLLDTSVGVLASVKYTIEKFGFAPLNDEQLSSFIGPPIHLLKHMVWKERFYKR